MKTEKDILLAVANIVDEALRPAQAFEIIMEMADVEGIDSNTREALLTLVDAISGDFLEFLALEGIPVKDKIWVAMRVLPREIIDIFAIDCAFAATKHAAYYAAADAAAAYAADAASAVDAAYYAAAAAAAYAADAASAAAAAAAAAERENQLDALTYLVINYNV